MRNNDKSGGVCDICGKPISKSKRPLLCEACEAECRRIYSIMHYIENNQGEFSSDSVSGQMAYPDCINAFEEDDKVPIEYIPRVVQNNVRIDDNPMPSPRKPKGNDLPAYEGGTTMLGMSEALYGGTTVNPMQGKTYAWLTLTDYPGRKYLDVSPYNIGNNTGSCNCVLNNSRYVSRLHAVIIRKDLGYYIRDNKSTNGTFLNGELLESNEECILNDGDKIGFGNVEAIFHIINN